MSGFSTIVDMVTLPVLLNQLAEECAELAQAALKYRRAIEGINATPVSAAQCRENLLEEIADVFLTVDAVTVVMKHPNPMDAIETTMRAKEARWARRLTNGHACGRDACDIERPPVEVEPPRMN